MVPSWTTERGIHHEGHEGSRRKAKQRFLREPSCPLWFTPLTLGRCTWALSVTFVALLTPSGWRVMVSLTEMATSHEILSDEEVVARVLAGETAMFEIIMRRHNQRLYRVARAILRNDAEAEDVMQDAYVRAYEHLDQFAGRAKFSTWLTRIAVHEALARQHRGNRYQELEPMSEREGDPMDRFASLTPNPEQQALNSEIRRLLEEAVEKLPDAYRTIFMLRDVEDMSTTDAADVLESTEDNVRARLHRARGLLRKRFAGVRQWKTRKYWN